MRARKNAKEVKQFLRLEGYYRKFVPRFIDISRVLTHLTKNSPSMYIPAKSELSGTEEIESRKEYFLKFNYLYQADELVRVWWQFRSKLMTIEEAKNLVEKVEP